MEVHVECVTIVRQPSTAPVVTWQECTAMNDLMTVHYSATFACQYCKRAYVIITCQVNELLPPENGVRLDRRHSATVADWLGCAVHDKLECDQFGVCSRCVVYLLLSNTALPVQPSFSICSSHVPAARSPHMCTLMKAQSRKPLLLASLSRFASS